MPLDQIGADSRVRELFRSHATPGSELARVSFSAHELYRVFWDRPDEECEAALAGRLRLADSMPAVGDWVAARLAGEALCVIEAVLPRRTQFARRGAGTAFAEQVIAANISQALVLVSAANPSLKTNLIDRLLISAHKGGAKPIICINKCDLVDPVRLQPIVVHAHACRGVDDVNGVNRGERRERAENPQHRHDDESVWSFCPRSANGGQCVHGNAVTIAERCRAVADARVACRLGLTPRRSD